MVDFVSPIDTLPKFVPVERATWDSVKDKLPNSTFVKNRARFFRLFKEKVQVNEQNKAVALFKGANEVPLHATDVSYPPYQEAFFYYIFGVTEMDCYGLLDFQQEKAILFVPKMGKLLEIWMTCLKKEDFATKYGLEVHYINVLQEFMATQCGTASNTTVYVNRGINSDSKLHITHLPE